MKKRTLGKTGLSVSVLGFGGSEIGYEGAPQADVDRLLNAGLDAGLNVIDTAECYIDSEEKIGQSVSHRRGEFHLFTKVGHPGGHPNQDWSRPGILKSIERSLERMKTDHVDLVHLHSCSQEELRKGEAIAALQEARERGLTRFIGYSGDSNAARYAVETGLFDTLQTSVNIGDQESLELTIPLAKEKNMGVIAKRPIANAAWKTGERPDSSYLHVYWDRLQKLRYDFLQRDVNDAVSIALRFTLTVPGVHTAIVGTTNPERWRQNAALLAAGPLAPEQIEAIRERWREVADASWVGQV